MAHEFGTLIYPLEHEIGFFLVISLCKELLYTYSSTSWPFLPKEPRSVAFSKDLQNI